MIASAEVHDLGAAFSQSHKSFAIRDYPLGNKVALTTSVGITNFSKTADQCLRLEFGVVQRNGESCSHNVGARPCGTVPRFDGVLACRKPHPRALNTCKPGSVGMPVARKIYLPAPFLNIATPLQQLWRHQWMLERSTGSWSCRCDSINHSASS